jgi:hypothetical protein
MKPPNQNRLALRAAFHSLHKPNIIVGCIYKHPTANLSDFTLELEGIIKNISEKNQHKYLHNRGYKY